MRFRRRTRRRTLPAYPFRAESAGGAPKGAIVIQVGQQLEILTGGRLLATPHVVTAPSQPGFTRCSAAHFVHMHAHELVRPLPEFASREAVTSYAPPV